MRWVICPRSGPCRHPPPASAHSMREPVWVHSRLTEQNHIFTRPWHRAWASLIPGQQPMPSAGLQGTPLFPWESTSQLFHFPPHEVLTPQRTPRHVLLPPPPFSREPEAAVSDSKVRTAQDATCPRTEIGSTMTMRMDVGVKPSGFKSQLTHHVLARRHSRP